jgi:pimeloyl-ACP methyl ester carboxylesterase
MVDGIDGARILEVKGAGHVIMLEAPDALCDLIESTASAPTR